MLTSDNLLHSYLRLLHDLSAAEAVSIYLPSLPDTADSSVLIHTGDAPAVPELADAATHRLASLPKDADGSPEPRGMSSQAPGGLLIPVPAIDEAQPAMWVGLKFSNTTARDRLRIGDLGATPGAFGRSAWRRALELGATLSQYRRPAQTPSRGDGQHPSRELDEGRVALDDKQLIYRSVRMRALLDTVRRVAPTDAGVLVTGASGTGKELVARTVHALSPRRGKPPVVVDCAAISASLIDNELFGHERGAYTGAAVRTVGRLAEAAGSTLILDEIGELPLEVQAKLLRFVQEKQITPVGGTRPRTVDVRLVAVTNRDLEEEVAAGRFRQDLYYRLKVIHAEVPSLAERPEDVPLLMDYYIGRFSARYGKDVSGLSSRATALAARHSWPGNVRELENRILQAVILCEGDEIGPEDLDLAEAVPAATSGTLDLDLGQLERRHIERVLESEGGSVAGAARRLGIQRNTLYQKIKKYGLAR